MKQCKRCLKTKPLSDFYKHSQMSDGYLNFCKECTKKRVSKHYYQNVEENRGKERERWKHRRFNPSEMKRRLLYLRTWRSKKKMKAHRIVDRKLTRPDNCDICGKICKPHGHHESYDRPFDVIWACPACHRKITPKTTSVLKDEDRIAEV